ncbi:desampylase [Halomarina salina]|uniref:Desampylase n=1 Tax=Halomarina salina TaxID=1872699 RepID=A0ABD5RLM0_9EURY|nr:desampylase [Halomarina salina]
MPSLRLDPRVHESLVVHARDGAPEEVCGVLGGDGGSRDAADDPARVTRLEHVPNVAERPRTRYELDPEAQFAALQRIEDDGDDVVGFYHSHPTGPAGPSPTDEAQATWPDAVYCIVSLENGDPTVGAWRWTGERFVIQNISIY